jgi:F-type H+-transporting ATPase subunit gamma
MDNDILHRMKSIRQTVQISSAQKLIAAAHIGRARKLLTESRPYHDRVGRSIVEVLKLYPDAAGNFIERSLNGSDAAADSTPDRASGKAPDRAQDSMSGKAPDKPEGGRGLLVIAASHGLAGGYNSNVVHFTERSLAENPAVYIIALGGACRSSLIRSGYPVDPDYDQPLDPPTMFTARELAEKVTARLDWKSISSFDVIYTAYRTATKMETVQRRLLPLNTSIFEGQVRDRSNYSIEPSPEAVMDSLISKYLKGYLYGCLVQSYISELTSRVTAMDSAIRNGNDMLDRLSLIYNRARQSAITQEITEIVAGAAALQTE